MAKFITSIQLQDADKRNYDTLYKALEKESFRSEKREAKSNTYVAGKEVFSLEDDITLQDVNDAVFRASSITGKNYSFFVIRHKKIA